MPMLRAARALQWRVRSSWLTSGSAGGTARRNVSGMASRARSPSNFEAGGSHARRPATDFAKIESTGLARALTALTLCLGENR